MSIKHLDKLVICHINCSIWSGRKKLRPEDFRLPDGSHLPPSEVASLGSKKICDPEALNHFERLKKEAQRQCELVGVRFLGGYAIPESLVKNIIPELDRIAQSFQHHKHLFLANYDAVTKGWVEKHPNFAEAITRAISPIQDVQERFQFDYTLYRMKPAKQKAELEEKVAGMGNTLLGEIARDANELFKLSIAGKDQLSQRAINPLRRMHSKLSGLAFLDNRTQPIIDTLGNLLERFPTTGGITGSLFHETVATVLMLTDPAKLQLHGEQLANTGINTVTDTVNSNVQHAVETSHGDKTTQVRSHSDMATETANTVDSIAKATTERRDEVNEQPVSDTVMKQTRRSPKPKTVSHYF